MKTMGELLWVWDGVWRLNDGRGGTEEYSGWTQ
jgi:hypothetical protein